ncbi:acyltransferase [Nocardioides rotundus]|uniref:acyltransferase family protein n=1 Tax=Nocardioides rotundus TaxID=1774216 RepID=UPI001CBBEC4B|nr:acyltransferase [Nocardioides rotundus]UAL28321.1 acyltransferase [Nocardioides rotundus]
MRPTAEELKHLAFPGLDTLRAVGALCVLTTHTAFWAGDYTRYGWLGTVMSRLDVGVAIFFVLSGFLLSRSWWLAAAHDSRRPGTGRYLWKRFLRIFPVYVITVAICYAFLAGNAGRSVGQLVSTLLLADVYTATSLPAGLTQMWSLSVEVAFYLVLPAVMLALVGRAPSWRPRRVALGLVVTLTVTAVWWLGAAYAIDDAIDAMPLQWLPGYLLWFAVGVGLSWLHTAEVSGRLSDVGRRVHALAERVAARPGALWTAALGLLLVSATPVAGPALLAAPTPAQSLTKNVLYAVIALLVVLPSVLGPRDTPYSRAMANPVARHVGLISYSLFCIHLPVLHFVMWSTGWELFEGRGLQIWAMTLVLSLAASELLYRLVERPAMRWRNLGSRRSPAPASTSTPTSDTSTR